MTKNFTNRFHDRNESNNALKGWIWCINIVVVLFCFVLIVVVIDLGVRSTVKVRHRLNDINQNLESSQKDAANYFSDPGIAAICNALLKSNDEEFNAMLKSGLDLSARGKHGITIPHWLYLCDYSDRIMPLVRHGAIIEVPLTGHFEPQSLYFWEGYSLIMTLSLSYPRQDRELFCQLLPYVENPNCVDEQGNSLLHRSVIGVKFGIRGIDTVSCVLDTGIDVDLKDSDGMTALQNAFHYELYNVALMLLEHGADPTIGDSTHPSVCELCRAYDRETRHQEVPSKETVRDIACKQALKISSGRDGRRSTLEH